MSEHIGLRDGSEVAIRRLTKADGARLLDAFERLSVESRAHRFLSPKSHLTSDEVRYLTDVDGEHHEALAAFDAESGAMVGVARYVRLEPGSDAAEVAVTVVDDWQGRGLGTALLERVSARARQAGIQRFTALVAADNAAMIELLRGIGAGIHAHVSSGALEYEIELEPAGMGEKLRTALRAAAAGRLAPPARVREALAALVPDRVTPD
jgi:RimJ/RimL family protein N-acetyltransferase